MLVDSHCHLDMLNLARHDGSLDAALAAARARGVKHFLCVSVELDKFELLRGIAEAHDDVSFSVGVHPCHTDAGEPALDDLLALAAHPKVVAIGETGLDYFHDASTREQQQRMFSTHIEVSRRTGKPLIIHTRSSREDVLAQMRAEGAEQAVMHCFTEDWDTAQAALDLGYFISISGIVTFPKALELKEVAKRIPLDRLLVETDSPYLAPVPNRGKPNEPAFLADTAAHIAELRGISLETLAEATTRNFQALFRQARLS
ncbi:TatD family hydrolase [Amnimonas aquatica]|uniref:Hydrolase TatD n=1 Tax=Amnimonas aquatica TaxID=2094561 RepID=A0A2P6AUW4_9GAMM|nr:TatD family hydrolase [Amnimonas aquatica]PQA50902.1 hydrolase TatD [Amnimonas aquatica]